MSEAGGASRSPLDFDTIARRGMLVVALVAAVASVLGGLAGLGVVLPFGATHSVAHGPLMVLGVFGTVIGLERAVAIARGWAFAAPLTSALSALAMLLQLPWAAWLAAASTAMLVGINVAIVRKQPAAFTWLMLAGSTVLFVGAFVWALGRPVFEVVPTWLAFFVLTIAAERLELSRLARTPRWATVAIVVLGAACAASACAAIALPEPSARVLGVSTAALGVWQLRFDVARRTVRQRGLPRFSAAGILSGSAWLVVAGAVLVVYGLPPVGPVYDAALHAVFVGYVLSMIFAHALIILPAVARVDVPFHPTLWTALAVLHLGLALRVAGDLASHAALRQAGGATNAVALVVFASSVVFARVARRRAHPRRRAVT